MSKYATIARLAARDQFVYLPSFLARNAFFVVVLFIFHSLWKVIYAGGSGSGGAEVIAGFTMTQALWYLTFTEAIEMSQTRIFRPISEEVKDGTVAYSINRPYSYPGYWITRGLGESLVKLVPMLIAGFVVASLFVGPLPGYAATLPAGLLVLVLGILLGMLWQTVIGLLAFWFEEVGPFYWIVQKMVFVLGGMFIPIDFFPEWIQPAARFSPFAFSAYWPASTMVAFSPERFLTTVTGQIIYIGLLATTAAVVFRSATRKLHAHGG